ncbi:TPA_asm: G [Zanthoxylum betacytorhabdovirus 1]|nr:TPA_asm: G [Zanthoxilum betacytorhabdovirus 1]
MSMIPSISRKRRCVTQFSAHKSKNEIHKRPVMRSRPTLSVPRLSANSKNISRRPKKDKRSKSSIMIAAKDALMIIRVLDQKRTLSGSTIAVPKGEDHVTLTFRAGFLFLFGLLLTSIMITQVGGEPLPDGFDITNGDPTMGLWDRGNSYAHEMTGIEWIFRSILLSVAFLLITVTITKIAFNLFGLVSNCLLLVGEIFLLLAAVLPLKMVNHMLIKTSMFVTGPIVRFLDIRLVDITGKWMAARWKSRAREDIDEQDMDRTGTAMNLSHMRRDHTVMM